MPAPGTLPEESKTSPRLRRSSLLLGFVLVASSTTLTGTLVNPSKAIETNEATSGSVINLNTGVNGAGVAVAQEGMPRPTLVDGASKPAAGKVLMEIGKQAIDQPGHFLIGAGPIWASRYLVGVPWYGWVLTPILAYREWHQWPSKRWWDPPLDWAFLTLGVVAATWSRRSAPCAMSALRCLGRWTARGLSLRLLRRGETAPDLVHAHVGGTPD